MKPIPITAIRIAFISTLNVNTFVPIFPIKIISNNKIPVVEKVVTTVAAYMITYFFRFLLISSCSNNNNIANETKIANIPPS